MSELNREQIVRNLERLVDKYGENGSYSTYCTLSDSLALIKELAEENESWRKRSVVVLGDGDNFEVTSLAKEMLGHPDPVGDPGECGLKHNCAVDTVQKMQERLKKELGKHYSPYFQVLGGELIDRIAKEILEENNG